MVGRRDSVHQGPSTVSTGDEGWTVHIDGSLQYRGLVVPQLTDLREEILREFHFS